MRVAVMQPYFFPYIGYFQLMRAVDTFVLFDDAQYIDRGYVNRNRIRRGGQAAWWTLPVAKGRREDAINSRRYVDTPEDYDRLRVLLREAYSKQPAFSQMIAVADEALGFPDHNVARFNGNLLRIVAEALGIGCAFLPASELKAPQDLRGQDRIVHICRRLGASTYVNPIGGAGLYREDAFLASGLQLKFLKTLSEPVSLSSGAEHLSILHGLAVSGLGATRSRLPEFELMRASEAGTARVP